MTIGNMSNTNDYKKKTEKENKKQATIDNQTK